MEGQTVSGAHGEIPFHAHPRIPGTEQGSRGADIFGLCRQTYLRGLLEAMAVIGTPIVRNEHELLQLMGPYEKIELFAGGLIKAPFVIVRHEPGGPTGNGPAIIAWDLQVLVAELIKGLAPT